MSDYELSQVFVQAIPRAMRSYRQEIREIAGPAFTVMQFRVLALLSRGASTTKELAEHIGVLPSAISRLVDVLASRGLVARKLDGRDRRKIGLRLTARGRARFQALRSEAASRLSARFTALTRRQKSDLSKGLSVLGEIFNSP